MFPKGELVNILGFVGQTVSVTIPSTKAARDSKAVYQYNFITKTSLSSCQRF